MKNTTNEATNMIGNTQDIIDSRDIIERIEQLTEAVAEFRGGLVEPHGTVKLEDAQKWGDDGLELWFLTKLAKEAADYAEDWEYGVTLIRDSYFQRYAEELADDIGAVPNDVTWPLTCIDWARAARELQMDYTSVDFDGVTYWVR